MGIIELHEGCKFGEPCFGPIGNYITIFGTELRLLTTHIIVSAIFGLLIFTILFLLKKRGKIKMNLYLSIIISLVSTVSLILIFAYLFPVQVIY